MWDAVADNHTEKSAKLKEYIQKLGLPGADNVNIDLADDKAPVIGENISQELKEKILVAIGNVAGLSGIDDKITAAAADNTADSPVIADAKAANRYYTVVAGDT